MASWSYLFWRFPNINGNACVSRPDDQKYVTFYCANTKMGLDIGASHSYGLNSMLYSGDNVPINPAEDTGFSFLSIPKKS